MSQQTIDKLQQLYKTGRYECDTWFYQKLIELVKEMEIHSYLPTLQENFTKVKKIHKLIEENSDSLNEDFDQEQAAIKAQQIKKQIHNLLPQAVPNTMSHLHKQRFTSYTQHSLALIQKYNHHPKYLTIYQMIMSSVYDPVVRVENVLVCVLFMLRNAGKVDEILAVYEKAIQGGLKVMKTFRGKVEEVKKVVGEVASKLRQLKKQKVKEQDNNDENIKKLETILTHVQTFCHGVYFIYSTTSKLCDLVKILQGKKNFILKLNSYKPDVEEILGLWDYFVSLSFSEHPRTKNHLKVIEKQMDHLPTKELKLLFIGDKSGIEKINRTCKICLRYVEKDERDQQGSAEYHRVCQLAVKELLREEKEVEQK